MKVVKFPDQRQRINIFSKTIADADKHNVNSLMTELKLIFILFALLGIDVDKQVNASNRNRTKHSYKGARIQRMKTCIGTCLKSLIYIIFFVKVLINTSYMVYAEDKRTVFTLFVLIVLKFLLYVSIYKKRRQIFRLTNDLNKALKALNVSTLSNMAKKFNLSCIVVLAIVLTWAAVSFCLGFSSLKAERFYFIQSNTSLISYIPYIVQVIEFPYWIVADTILCLFVFYYVFICKIIRILFRNFQKQLGRTHSTRDFMNGISCYEDILKNMNNFNEQFSIPAFLVVLITMMAVFRAGYKLAFKEYVTLHSGLALTFAVLFCFSVQLALMISACLTNEAKSVTHCSVRRLFYRFCTDSFKFVSLKTDSSQSTLTLGKIYQLDRSLIIASIATLLTYGILLGTLGK
ncbi:hypothetical protein AVEN_176392-1 [Araneus ventricosus]|uniref:Gustatory receptor n=1 Tax=Araneus ventricosus TaxID=182803 RepID=A0A4Y2C912_ARAVE|nr:hypothetical protein AVEN_176392-1 [Araneus ventricosus]